MYLLIEVRHNFLKECHGNDIGVKKVYALKYFKTFGCPEGYF